MKIAGKTIKEIRSKLARSQSAKMEGMSLIEVIVSVALFSVIIMSATQIFKMVIDGQRSALAAQNVQESLKYFLEVTGKEIRMAQKNDNFCYVDDYPGQIYRVTSGSFGSNLFFRNYYGECVAYSLILDSEGNRRFHIQRDSQEDFISPEKIRIDYLNFILSAAPTSTQPLITMNLKAWALDQAQFKSEMTIQTSLSSRYYK